MKNARKKIILFGTGKGYRSALLNAFFDSYDVVAVVDSDSKIQGFITSGCCIIAPDRINDYDFDYIYITSKKYYQEMSTQLINNYKIDRKK